MTRKNGAWTIKKSRKIYENDFFKLIEDDVIQPDGKDGKYAVVEMKAGVSILPIGEDGNVYLTRQFRYALGAESLETPCGAIEKGETPLKAAKRELREELGIEAKEWTALGTAETDTSIVKSAANFFVARKLKFGKTEPDSVEEMKIVKMSFDEAVEKVLSGKIKLHASCLLILKAKLTIKK